MTEADKQRETPGLEQLAREAAGLLHRTIANTDPAGMDFKDVKQLTGALLQYLSNLGACYATLEVRVSNERAQHLYKSFGFVSVGKRKRYYEDNGEDAFLMVCEHMPETDPDFAEEPVEEEEPAGKGTGEAARGRP